MHENETSRKVYQPPGTWFDYQTGEACSERMAKIEAGGIPEIIQMCASSVIPHIALAQNTAQMDWSKIELTSYAKNAATAKGFRFLPGENEVHELKLTKSGDRSKLEADPLAGKASWNISSMGIR